jgi:hypothetical protein
MTPSDDSPRDDAPHGPTGPTDGPADSEAPLDEDAAWRAIVENYGERPRLGDSWPTRAPVAEEPDDPPSARGSASLFDRSFLDAYSDEVGAAAPHRRHDDDHFVPPPPPPLPKGTPARRLAWLGVLVPPVVMFVSVLARWVLPTWAPVLLVVAFLGGFVFLVATMPRGPRDDGDDGAVV